MRPLNIQIACPAKPGTRLGNRITALRWQSIFRSLGHRPQIVEFPSPHCDLFVALHANRSAAAIKQFRDSFPQRPMVLTITGTDVSRDGNTAATNQSLKIADRIVLLQPMAIHDLPARHHNKTRVIFQSIAPVKTTRPQHPRSLRVTVAGHLRRVKDPFRTAMAVRDLPTHSKIVVEHYGGVIEPALKAQAIAEAKRNDRYRWHGDVPHGRLRIQLAKSWMMAISSKHEGGAGIVSEAIVNHIPVIASRIAGNIGLLGKDYAGYFGYGKTRELRSLLLRCENEPKFLEHLRDQIAERTPLFQPKREQTSWKKLIAELR